MGDFDVAIKIADPDVTGVPLGTVTVQHHKTPRAEVTADVLSGGHLLHLAVATCIFNDILTLAAKRGITVSSLKVRAGGGFEGMPLISTGISYAVEIAGDRPAEELRDLVAVVEQNAAIPISLRRGTTVNGGDVTVVTAPRE